MSDKHPSVVWLALAVLSSPSGAQTPAAPAGGAGDPPLAGPAIGGPSAGPLAGKASIVERDFEGRLKPLDARPEEAGVLKLDLSDAERSAVRRVLDDRAVLMDRIVRDNVDLLLRTMSARQSGDKARVRAIAEEYKAVFAPLNAKGGLMNELAAVLPPDKSDLVRTMVREYWQALIADEKRHPDAAGDDAVDGQGRGATARVALEAFGQEIKRSYDRIAADGVARLERIIKDLGLSPEQEGTIRRLALDYAQETKQKPTAEQKTAFFHKIMIELTPEQKGRFLRLIRDGAD